MLKKITLILALTVIGFHAFSQPCNCETEVKYIAGFMEKNYAGFKDKQALMTKVGYDKILNDYVEIAKQPHANEHCLLIIEQYLAKFKDQHVSVVVNFDAFKLDSAYLASREIITLSTDRIAELRKSKGFEGIYDFHDPAKYKIAVIKDKTPLHDYLAVIVSSNLPGWKPGMIKWEGKMINDSVAHGILYILNGMPKSQDFYFKNDQIYSDWHREGTIAPKPIPYKYEPVAFRKLSNNIAYLKISTFSPSNAKNIDSIIKANQSVLLGTPDLILDLRGNGGGADYTFQPLMNLIYTGPIKHIGNDLLSTDANISGWQNLLNDDDRSEDDKQLLKRTIAALEANRSKMVVNSTDFDITNYKIQTNPANVVILIDNNCASTTEEFLLQARQSKKVTLIGQNTSGTLDYSNVIQTKFLCMPYILRYSSSRSRRLDVGQGIDEKGIKPAIYLNEKDDWIKKAQQTLER